MQTAGRSDWVVAICSVVFDLDVGQQMESVYPTAAISETTAASVAFHSFPVSARDEQLMKQTHKSYCFASNYCLHAVTVLLWVDIQQLYLQDSMSMELQSRSSVRDRLSLFGLSHWKSAGTCKS